MQETRPNPTPPSLRKNKGDGSNFYNSAFFIFNYIIFMSKNHLIEPSPFLYGLNKYTTLNLKL